ncbi:Sec14p-like phosphatidylinositol transfer family protein [Striga asiatica]|uniref:Sec14p-like phosphatidylinositol transfer family protein n=1 Tax=Striga asiatica TaxID=4170 RepID=A0A5A7PXX4_STRAF|nr:Sec14p-like phosphatidylinositol transfer family protein [Striga asiatica]
MIRNLLKAWNEGTRKKNGDGWGLVGEEMEMMDCCQNWTDHRTDKATGLGSLSGDFESLVSVNFKRFWPCHRLPASADNSAPGIWPIYQAQGSRDPPQHRLVLSSVTGSLCTTQLGDHHREVAAPAPPPCEDPEAAAAAAPLAPEEVSIWAVRLLADEKSDAILLKFRRPTDFNVKEDFAILKSVVPWRKEFKIEELLDEENIFLEKNIRKLDFRPGWDRSGDNESYDFSISLSSTTPVPDTFT